jgi:TRIAD3 protein (E3 ubiquitin-protein ligase RNF216)|tara:strand:- start:7633 stop:8223 length:591 start_codon:yes stop_codon:yes gene_type:complete
MANSEPRRPHEVVYVGSDGEDEGLSEDELDFFDAISERQGPAGDVPDMDAILDKLIARHDPGYEALGGIIDLTAIPDIDVPPSDDMPMDPADPAIQKVDKGPQLVSAAVCLQMVLDVLPDISIDHVLELISETTTDATRTVTQCETIITGLLDGEAYPKETDEAKNRKRKRTDEDDWRDYEKAERDPEVPTYESDA